MENLIYIQRNRFLAKMALLVLLGLTIVSCKDSATTSPERDDGQTKLEEILAKKLGPGVSTEEAFGMTMQELEAAYYAISNEVETTSKSVSVLASDALSFWESDYGTDLDLADDGCQAVEIGFPFTFYGTTYTEIWVNANGNLTFDECNPSFFSTNIPDGSGKVIIGPVYGDFTTSDNGDDDILFNTVGTSPNRTFVVTWLEVPALFQSGTNTFQVQLAEGTNSIIFGYNGISTSGKNILFGSNMNVGISSGSSTDPVRFINSATGGEIPGLDMINICYVLEDGKYVEILPCGNTPPVAVAGPDQTVECAGDLTTVSLDGSGSSDPDKDPITYSWSLNGSEIATGATPSIQLPMGSHTILLTVTDSFDASHSDEVIVDIVDTTPPELAYTVNTNLLWPPNRDMYLSVSGISASDICDPNHSLLVTVTDNTTPTEGESTSADWEIVENGDGTIDVFLRAEKGSGNSDRIYTITMTAEDVSGNVAVETVEVTVPKSNRGNGRNTNRGTGRNNN